MEMPIFCYIVFNVLAHYLLIYRRRFVCAFLKEAKENIFKKSRVYYVGPYWIRKEVVVPEIMLIRFGQTC
jgi:hypothetical protein